MGAVDTSPKEIKKIFFCFSELVESNREKKTILFFIFMIMRIMTAEEAINPRITLWWKPEREADSQADTKNRKDRKKYIEKIQQQFTFFVIWFAYSW